MSPTADDGDIGPAWDSPAIRRKVVAPVVHVVYSTRRGKLPSRTRNRTAEYQAVRSLRAAVTRQHVARLVRQGYALASIALKLHLSYNRVCHYVVDARARGELAGREK